MDLLQPIIAITGSYSLVIFHLEQNSVGEASGTKGPEPIVAAPAGTDI